MADANLNYGQQDGEGDWHELPEEVLDSLSMEIFRSHLDTHCRWLLGPGDLHRSLPPSAILETGAASSAEQAQKSLLTPGTALLFPIS